MKKSNKIIFGVLIAIFLVSIISASFYGLYQQTALSGDYITKNYIRHVVENEDGIHVLADPLSSCNLFTFAPEAPSKTSDCKGEMPDSIKKDYSCYGEACPAEGASITTEKITPTYIIDTKNSNIESQTAWTPSNYGLSGGEKCDNCIITTYVGGGKKILKDSVKKSTYSYEFKPTYRSTSNPQCWEVKTNLFNESFKVGDRKKLNDCIEIQFNDFYAGMRGGQYDTKTYTSWTIYINKRCWYAQQTKNEHQIIFQEPYIAEVSTVNLMGYQFCGGIEGKITEVGFFTGTQFEIPIKQDYTLIKGCSLLPIEIPTDKLRKVDMLINPLILWSDNERTKGMPLRWTYDREAKSLITEAKNSSAYDCPQGLSTEDYIDYAVKTQAKPETTLNLYTIVPIALIILGIIAIMAISLIGMTRKRRGSKW